MDFVTKQDDTKWT